jgi:hypothetical protein
VKKAPKKLTLSRDTLRSLVPSALGDAAGAGTYGCGPTAVSCYVSCGCTVTCNINCFPSAGQNCTVYC